MVRLSALFNGLLTSYQPIIIEAVLVVVFATIAIFIPYPVSNWFRRVEKSFARLARHRVLSVFGVGLLALAGRVMLLPTAPIPQPGTHDEFSYLLAADTFASGRLTNPTHPLWIHFESIHIIQKPSYMSMYPIGQSMVMATGKVLFGHPWWGVWLTAGMMCAALCWMLQAWLPPAWALLGGLLAVIRLALFSYWMNGYMGGAMAAFGGALVLGALPRIMRHQRTRDAIWLGLGIICLANSRPNEGFFLALGAMVVLAAWTIKRRPAFRSLILRVGLPLTSLLLLMCLAMGFYFWRVTGNPLLMPYQVNRSTYATAPLFLFETPQPEPNYNHVVMRDFYRWEQGVFDRSRSLKGALARTLGKFATIWLFYLGPALSMPLIMLPRVFHDRRVRPLLVAGTIALPGILIPAWFNAHYAAPITGLIYAVFLQGMRHLRAVKWRGKKLGLSLALSVPLVCLIMASLRIVPHPMQLRTIRSWRTAWCCTQAEMLERAEVVRRLEALPGGHLVVVRYSPDHDVHSEWVYNEADIDRAKIVWAREMDSVKNEALINYFKGRRVWLLEADEKPPRLSPYQPAASRIGRSEYLPIL